MAGYYEKGYAARYTTIAEAEQIHAKLILSPLGTLSKFKPDGSLKHRIIQDLRRGGANLLASMFERIVLPRPTDHGWNLYDLWLKLTKGQLPPDSKIWSLIVDFEDAFMSTGTQSEEQRFTAAEVEDSNSTTGTFVYVWKTLGF